MENCTNATRTFTPGPAGQSRDTSNGGRKRSRGGRRAKNAPPHTGVTMTPALPVPHVVAPRTLSVVIPEPRPTETGSTPSPIPRKSRGIQPYSDKRATPKKAMWWIDDQCQREREEYDRKFDATCVGHAYAMKMEKLKKQRERELLGKSFRAWADTRRVKMQSGIENTLLDLSSHIKDPRVCDLAENVLLMAYNLARASSVLDYMVAAVAFLKSQCNGPLLTPMYRKHLQPFINALLTEDDIIEMQSGLEGNIQKARNIISFWPRLKSSPLWRKVNTVIVYTTSFALFGPDTTREKALRIEDQYYRNRAMLQADFTHNVLDLLLYVAERGVQVVKSKKVDPMFHSGEAYESWYDKASDLIAKAKFLSNPEVHGIDVHNFTTELDDLIQKGQTMYKYSCELDRGAKNLIRGACAQLLQMRATYLNRKVGQKTRKAPLAIVLEGHSAVAKTTFANLLHYYYGTLCGKNTAYGARYTRMSYDEYWPNFSSDQWSILLDDAASLKPGATSDMDFSIRELLQLINNAPFSANMAAVEEKGACPVLPELVVATTNTPNLNLDYYFNVPGAVARRFPFHVRIRPKPEYTRNRTRIDEERLPEVEPGYYPDWWTIEIFEPIQVPMSDDPKEEFRMTFDLVPTHKFGGMAEFLKWYANVIERHNAVQLRVSASEESLRVTGLCSACKLPVGMCSCPKTGVIRFGSDAPIEVQVPPSDVEDEMPDLLSDNEEPQPVLQAGRENFTDPIFGDTWDDDINNLVSSWTWQLLSIWWFAGLSFWNIGVLPVTFLFVGRYWSLFYYLFSQGCTQASIAFMRYFLERVRASVQDRWTRNITEFGLGVYERTEAGAAAMRRCGDSVQRVFFEASPFVKLVIAVLGAVVLGFTMLWAYRQKETTEMQGAYLSSIGQTPMSLGETENVWKKETYTPSTYDLGRHTLSWKTMSDDEIQRVLLKNCAFVRFQQGDHWKVAKCIALGGQYYMTTNHSMPKFDGNIRCRLVRDHVKEGPSNSVQFLLSACDVKRSPSKDLVIFRCRSSPPTRKIVDLFVREKLKNFRADGYYLGRSTNGEKFLRLVRGVYEGTHFNTVMGCPTQVWWGLASTATENGDCGCILVGKSGSGPIILGLHQLGTSGNKVGAIKATYEDVMGLLGDALVVDDAPPMLDAPSTNVGVPGELHPKSPVNFLEEGTFDCLGSFEGWRANPKFCVRESTLAPYLKEKGYSVEHGPPLVKGWEPKFAALSELSHVYPDVDASIVDKAVEGYVEDICKIDPKWKKDVMIYDVHTAINGVPGLKYVDGIKRNTSAGFPYGKPKEFYLHQLEPTEEYPDHVMIDDEVVERVEEMIRRYESGSRAAPVFRAAFKNEPLPIEKTKKGKVRTFMMANIELTIVMRMYTLCFVRIAQSNHFAFECAVGIEAQSCEWDVLYQFLTQYGKRRTLWGDYKWYDKSMHPIFVLAAFECIARFLERFGATAKHVRVVRCMGYDIAFAYVDFFGDLIEFYGKNPSGQALTAPVNGIVNSLYARFVWIHCSPEKHCFDFQLYVAYITYGDDNGAGVSYKITFFNHSEMQRVLATIGVTYTMADKESESVEFVSMEQGSFLKRSWRFEAEFGSYVAPLELKSISKMLMVTVPSSVVSPEVQAADTIRSANDEYFWHGRQIFEEKHAMLKEVAETSGVAHHMQAPLPTWEDLSNRYIDASRRYIETTDLPSFVDESRWRFVEMQSGRERATRCPCGRTTCRIFDFDDIRLCANCGLPKIDDLEVYCDHCGVDDTCPGCGNIYISEPGERPTCWRCHDTYPPVPILECSVCGGPSAEYLCATCIRISLQELQAARERGDRDVTHDDIVQTMLGDEEESRDDVPSQVFQESVTPPASNISNDAVHATSPVAEGPEPCPTIGASGMRTGENHPALWVESGDENGPANTQDLTPYFQSGEEYEANVAGADVMAAPASSQELHQTVQFVDSGVGDTFSFPKADESMFTYDKQANAELGDFMSRPILIQSLTWTPGVLSTTSFDPWSLYLGNTAIKKKLDNYAFFRGNLKIKVVVNAAPFYYGMLLLYYTPLPANVIGLSPTTGVQIQQSQRPHIWISPQANEGGQMTLPFFYPQNYVDITSASSVATLGSLTFTAFTQLQSANGATSNGVQIQVYAWMEDVTLFGPTTSLSMQAGDEYGNGPVSAPATAIAHWATYLSRVPIIGRFAKATSIGASAVSQMAQIFGWTNVPVIEDVKPMKNMTFHDLASAHISEPTTKFLLDPKAELSVDPRVVGLPGDDELSVAHLVQKESYLSSSTWSAGATPGALLFSANVSPWMVENGTASAAGTNLIAMTPMAWVSAAFNNWRGDIIFRFKVVASQFHSGRLRIHWDPKGSGATTSDLSHLTYTAILDLQESDEIEFRVPYMQALPWMTNKKLGTQNQFSTASSLTPTSGYDNGSLVLRVLNNLSAPVDTASVSVLVFVRGAENLEFANPIDITTAATYFNMQSGEEPMSHHTPHDERYLVNWGEAIPSVRLLLRRSSLLDRITARSTMVSATDEMAIYRSYQSRFPPLPGYDPSAYTKAMGVETPGTSYPFSYTYWTALSWFSGAFVAMRGSTRWHYNVVNPGGTITSNVTVTRRVGQPLAAGNQGLECAYVQAATVTAISQSLLKGKMWNACGASQGASGTFLTNPNTQTGVGVEYPMMTNYLFQYANPRNWLLGLASDGSSQDNYIVDVDVHPVVAASGVQRLQLYRYVAAGTDFTLHWFLNTPVVSYNTAMGAIPV